MQNLTNEFCELRKQYIDAKFMTMNPMQKKAIYNVDGPVLVLAGAGSGKTTTIIGRIVYMVMFGHAYYSTKTTFPVTENDIKELKSVLAGTGSISEHLKSMLQVKPISPQNIMAVTFTNKAAGEMKKRLESKLGKDMAEKVYAKTFHSACVGILREYAMFVGFKRDFTIYDEKDCKSVLKDIYKANGIKEKELHKDDVLNHISIWKDKMITPDMAISQSTISSYNTVAHLYKEYQERLKNANAMDFDDLIGNTIQLLKEHPDIQAELQKKIQYIMVDEYQDTNASQHELLSLLVSPEHNICVVGDDDQSIYSFRGADVDNILNFPQEFDGTHIIKMEQNYRSDGNILNLAKDTVHIVLGNHELQHKKMVQYYRILAKNPTVRKLAAGIFLRFAERERIIRAGDEINTMRCDINERKEFLNNTPKTFLDYQEHFIVYTMAWEDDTLWKLMLYLLDEMCGAPYDAQHTIYEYLTGSNKTRERFEAVFSNTAAEFVINTTDALARYQSVRITHNNPFGGVHSYDGDEMLAEHKNTLYALRYDERQPCLLYCKFDHCHL